jgi:hypothetical protein
VRHIRAKAIPLDVLWTRYASEIAIRLVTVVLCAACTPTLLEVDIIVDQHGATFQYRGEGCECQSRFPQPGEGFQHQPNDTNLPDDCECAQTCLEGFDAMDDGTVILAGCGRTARAGLPVALTTPPMTQMLDPYATQFAVTVVSPATSFYYSYGCPGGGDRFNEFHVPATSGIARSVCARTTPLLIRSLHLVNTLQTEIGTVRLWASYAVSL